MKECETFSDVPGIPHPDIFTFLVQQLVKKSHFVQICLFTGVTYQSKKIYILWALQYD